MAVRGGQGEAAATLQTLEEDPKPGQGPGGWGRGDQIREQRAST